MRSQNGAMSAALSLPRRGADGQTNTRLRIFSFTVPRKKDRPEEGRSLFASNTIASRPIGVAEGHSMSILLFGFLGWSLGRVTDKMPLSYFALIASLSTSPT